MRVMLDACVLYPTVMREMLLGCADAGLFEARWSPRILEEWARAAGKLGPAEEVWARGEIATLNAKMPASEVRYDESFARKFWLPDPADVHVLAAAVAGSCDGIVTMNSKDFPRNILGEEALLRWDPDAFVMILHKDAPQVVSAVADRVLAEANRLSDRPWTMRALMKKARLPKIGKTLEKKV
ncbi:RSP_2648 family PIN domain-containing protein [Yoonia litorea]|uniref:PIN domain-containing protein n=1 Tax=Yoonia litorea TaxID=1123755 RepID=A0A1I6LZ33_9RHOB|nr:PIN domain-containing protein [Yoonia litorea]SFS08542.1 PIN domain-containing protein [Yoonia litorea]